MKIKKPKFWDYNKPNIISYILWPLSFFLQFLSNLKLLIVSKKKFEEIKEKNAARFMQEKIESLRKAKPSNFFKKIKQLGKSEAESGNNGFIITSHVDAGLSDNDAAEKIAEKFSQVSKELPALNVETLPERVKQKLKKI